MGARLLIIGAGKMGGALLSAFLTLDDLNAGDIAILDPNPGEAASRAIKAGAKHLKAASKIPKTIDTVLLGIKPQMFATLGPEIAANLPKDALILSILAGTSLREMEAVFGQRPVIRAMPNTPAALGQGVTALTAGHTAKDADLATADQLFATAGTVVHVESESQINAVTALSGSGPAYIFHMCEAMRAAGQDVGLSPETANALARQTIIGAAALLGHDETDAAELRKNVTSPNGTTQAALDELMAPDGLTPLMTRAIRAAYKRAKALAGGS